MVINENVLRFGLKEHDIDLISGVFSKYPEIKEVIIYGSRAKGNYKPGSDIDLVIKGTPIFMDIIAEIKFKLEEDLPLPYFFDVADFNSINNPELIEHINRVGKIFYKAVNK